MLVSFAIFHKGGLILYQHIEEASETSEESLALSINTWLSEIYFNPTLSKTVHKNQILVDSTRMVIEWEETSELIALAIYPDLRHEDSPWIRTLLMASLQEYQVFAQASASAAAAAAGVRDQQELSIAAAATSENQALFGKTFQIIFRQHRKESKNNSGPAVTAANSNDNKNNNNNSNNNNNKGGKEKRQWHDGKAKVTKKAMEELDKSKATTEEDLVKNEEQALAEARAAYLPTDADLEDFDVEDTTQLVDDENDDDWVAHILMNIMYQNDYPLEVTPPKIQITWFTLTKKSLITSSNKPLESLGVLDEIKLIQSMSDYAQEFLLGMPSVYELLDTWLSEHLFEYIDCPSRQK